MRVLLADDHSMVRQGIRTYLQSKAVEIVGEATNGLLAVKMAGELKPDVVIMDIHMPELTGIEATRRILFSNPETRILVLTAYDTPAYVHALLDAGADGFILKTAEFEVLYQALQEVAVGRKAFDHDVMAKASQVDDELTAQIGSLTKREIEIVTHVGYGKTNKEIGKELFISDRTVQGHLKNIYAKLGVTTRTEAVTVAITHSIDLAKSWVKSDADRAVEMLQLARQQALEVVTNLRNMIAGLRPPALEELGLIPALEMEIERIGDLSVDLKVKGVQRRLSESRELALFRATQEAFKNACKHSHADKVLITKE